MCTYISFLWQALEIQNLYKISVETHLQCLLCDSVQTQTSYLLSLPLHIKEDHNSLVLLLFNTANYFKLLLLNSSEFKLMSIPNVNIFRKAA